MYNVVFRTVEECSSKGVIAWSSFDSKEAFEKWYDETLQNRYEVVEAGVTGEHAVELCSSAEATMAAVASSLREIEGLLS